MFFCQRRLNGGAHSVVPVCLSGFEQNAGEIIYRLKMVISSEPLHSPMVNRLGTGCSARNGLRFIFCGDLRRLKRPKTASQISGRSSDPIRFPSSIVLGGTEHRTCRCAPRTRSTKGDIGIAVSSVYDCAMKKASTP